MTANTETVEDIIIALTALPDQRFDVLRGCACGHTHKPGYEEDGCTAFWDNACDCHYYTVKTDLGSLVRAAAACGPDVLDRICGAIAYTYRTGREPEWTAAMALRAAVAGEGTSE